jgi:hypothetical protein
MAHYDYSLERKALDHLLLQNDRFTMDLKSDKDLPGIHKRL